jgi:hypothetical protein
MTTWRSVQPPATPAERRRPRRSGSPQQIDLFAGASPTEVPAWRELPEETRGALTSLMVRLILEHAHANGAVWRTEAGDDL